MWFGVGCELFVVLNFYFICIDNSKYDIFLI